MPVEMSATLGSSHLTLCSRIQQKIMVWFFAHLNSLEKRIDSHFRITQNDGFSDLIFVKAIFSCFHLLFYVVFLAHAIYFSFKSCCMEGLENAKLSLETSLLDEDDVIAFNLADAVCIFFTREKFSSNFLQVKLD